MEAQEWEKRKVTIEQASLASNGRLLQSQVAKIMEFGKNRLAERLRPSAS